jgi:antirestriction protein ArdC
MVVKFGTFNLKESAPASSEDGKQRKGMFLRSYTVFNATQIEGISFPETVSGPALSADQRNAKAESIVAAMPQCPVIHCVIGSNLQMSMKTVKFLHDHCSGYRIPCHLASSC